MKRTQWSIAASEFPDWTPPAGDLPEGFTDDSWHNDVCPKAVGGNVIIWADYADPENRQNPDRYSVTLQDDEGGYLEESYIGDDWPAACQAASAEKLCGELRRKYPDHAFETAGAREIDGNGSGRVIVFARSLSNITDPFASVCSRFRVIPSEAYGIDYADAVRIAAHNYSHGVVYRWVPGELP